LSSSACSNHYKAGYKKEIEGSKGKHAFISLFFVLSHIILSPFLGIFIFSSCLYSYISYIIRTFAGEKKKNKMDKYIILSPEAKGTFNDRLNFLYLKLGNYLDTEKLENRTLQYCKVFLSDAQNQTQDLEESLLYQEYLKDTHLTVVEQPPLNGSKISLLIKTTDDKTPILFHSLRLTEEEAKGKDSYEQTRMLFDKYQQLIAGTDMTMERNLVRTWIYVTHIDVNYQGVVEARNDVFDQQGLTAETHYIASTGIGGATSVRHASVAIDFLTVPGIREEDKQYLQALNHLNPTHEYGVAFERGTSLSLPQKKQYFISGTASIDKDGAVVYEGDIIRQTGRLLENIGALLKDGDAMMNDIQYFIIYLRDISDYYTVEQLMNQFYPQIPHITVEARVCRPGWLIEMECIAEKQEQK
jgi:enamine deaminase RidA (YjgF/YER057c/UK114 family)